MREIPLSPYVYTLSDGDGAVFYVGKGNGARMYQHVAGALRGKPGPKHDKIREILAAGGQVEYAVVGEFGSDEDAVAEENRLIQSLRGLTNIAGPRKCPNPRRALLAELRKVRRLRAAVLPFYLWNRGGRSAYEQMMYGKVSAEIDEVERLLSRKVAELA